MPSPPSLAGRQPIASRGRLGCGGHMVVLVLGATGNVGSRLVDILLELGHRVRVMTRDPKKAARWGGKVDVGPAT